VASFEPGGQGFESLRAHFLSKKVLRQPGPRDWKRADRTPDGQQDGSTTRRRAGLDVAASAAAVRSEAEDERRSREHSVRGSIQIWSKPPISRLDRQLGGRPYIAIRQLSNVRAAPQATTLKALLLPTPRCLFQATVSTLLDSAQPSCHIFTRASIYEPGGREFESLRAHGLLARYFWVLCYWPD
jgi:hypothetical protein